MSATVAGALIVAGPAPAFAADEQAPRIVDTGMQSGLVGLRPTLTMKVADNVGVVRVEVLHARVRLADVTVTGAGEEITVRPDFGLVRSPGPVDILIRAHDAAGNVAEAAATVMVDRDLPTATLNPPLGHSLRGTASVTLTGVSPDTTLIKLVHLDTRVEWARATAAPWTLTWNTVGQRDFPMLYLYDQAGNENVIHTVWHMDNELPQLGGLTWRRTVGATTFTSTNGRVGGTGTLSASIKDEGKAAVEWRLDGKAQSTSPAWTWNTGSANRTAAVDLRAQDPAGNVATRRYSVVVDNTGPAVQVTSPAALVRGSRISSAVRANDPSGIHSALLAGAKADTAAPYTASIAAGRDGRKTLTWTVYDRVGNTTVVRRAVTVDNTGAKVAFGTAPKNKAKVKGTVKVTASASDKNGVARVELLVNGKMVAKDAKAAYKFSVNTKKYGKKIKVQLRAYDRAGNVTTTSARTWRR